MAIKAAIKSPNTVRKEMIDNISERSGINYWGKDGVARSLVDVFTSEQKLIEARAEAAIRGIQVSTATGENLDGLAESKGINRLQPTYAQSNSNEKNFMFYSLTTFGDLNGGADIVLPKGTKITVGRSLANEQNLSDNNLVEYVTVIDYVLPASGKTFFCSIRASAAGSFNNVGENSLINHNFTNYLSGKLYCKNNYSILNGRNLENDESLRFRIANVINSHSGATELALQLSAIQVPGVTKVQVVSGYYGIGTAAVFVFGVDNESNQELVNAVQRRINSYQTAGLKIIAVAGVKVHFDFEILAYVKPTVNGPDRKQMEEEIKKTINSYFFNGTGDPLKTISVKGLEQAIVSNSRLGKLSSIRGNNRSLFNKIFIRKGYGGSRTTGERATLDANSFTLAENEYAAPGTIQITFENVSGDN
jgi:uncharacterized phage protein gp47/JayE